MILPPRNNRQSAYASSQTTVFPDLTQRVALLHRTMNLPSDSSHEPSSRSAHQRLAELWEVAVKRYSKEARLTKAEEEELLQRNTPNDIFESSKTKWDKNVIDKRWKYHDTAQQTVGQVLGMFDVLDAALGFAAAVLPS